MTVAGALRGLARPALFAACPLILACGGFADPGRAPGPMRVPLGDSPQRGPADAWVTIVEFADYECPFSAASEGPLQAVLAERPADVRLVYKHFPLYPEHPFARTAAVAAECARVQGPATGRFFWELHDLFFQHQDDLSGPALLGDAGGIAGLDQAAWTACTGTLPPLGRVLADQAWGMAFGVTQTPTFSINGERLVGVPTTADLRASIEAALAWAEASRIPRGSFYETAVLGVASAR